MNPLDPANIMSLATDINRMRSSDQAEIDRLRKALEDIQDYVAKIVNDGTLADLKPINQYKVGQAGVMAVKALKGGQA